MQVSGTDEKTMQSYSLLMDSLHFTLDIKIREAYEMQHVLQLFSEICPRTAENIEETSPLLLQHVEHSLKDSTRVLLKLLSTGFPKEFNVAVILEGLQSDLDQVHSAIQVRLLSLTFSCYSDVDGNRVFSLLTFLWEGIQQEVLENLLPSPYRGLVLPLLFQKLSSKGNAKVLVDCDF